MRSFVGGWCTKYSTGISCVVNNSLAQWDSSAASVVYYSLLWSPVDFTLFAILCV